MVLAACGPKPAPTPTTTAELGDEEVETEPTPSKCVSKPHSHDKTACAASLEACPARGCEDEGTAHAVFNEVKRRDASGVTFASATPITFDTMVALQSAAQKLVGQGCDIEPADRARIASLDVGGKQLGEGMPVRIVGHLAPHTTKKASSGVHPGGVESVNCRLTKAADKDIHIPLIPSADATECEGVVVEMVPQGRGAHPKWTETGLHAIKPDVEVMVVGPLFYDNEHEVNADCGNLVPYQPKRASLWEVHPIAELYTCDASTCSVDSLAGWTKVD
jgi:hypothetical protein